MRKFIQLFACSFVCAHKLRDIGFLCDAHCYFVPNIGTGCRILAPVWRAIWFHRRIRFSVPNPPADPVLIGGYGSGRNHIRRVAYGGLDSRSPRLLYSARAHFAMSYVLGLQACMQKTDHFRQAQTPQTSKIRSEFAHFLSPLDTN